MFINRNVILVRVFGGSLRLHAIFQKRSTLVDELNYLSSAEKYTEDIISASYIFCLG